MKKIKKIKKHLFAIIQVAIFVVFAILVNSSWILFIAGTVFAVLAIQNFSKFEEYGEGEEGGGEKKELIVTFYKERYYTTALQTLVSILAMYCQENWWLAGIATGLSLLALLVIFILRDL